MDVACSAAYAGGAGGAGLLTAGRLSAAEGAGEVGGAAEARLCRDFFKGAALATK